MDWEVPRPDDGSHCDPVPPCTECKFVDHGGASQCVKCADKFALADNGLGGSNGCYLPSEDGFLLGFEVLFFFLLAILLAGMTYSIVKNYIWGPVSRWYKKRYGKGTRSLTQDLSGKAELSEEAMHAGWRFAQLTKIENWDSDVHREFIVGVGLPLYYNFHFLIMAAAIVTWLCLYIVCTKSGLEGSLQDLKAATAAGADANTLENIGHEVEKESIKFAELMYWGVLSIYLGLLAFSWRYATNQKHVIKEFDRLNSSMSDYCLRLWGVPREMTNEEELKKVLEKIFNSLLPPGAERVAIKGITIPYDMVHLRSLGDDAPDVDKLIEHLIVMEDCKVDQLYSETLREQANKTWGKAAVQADIDKVKKVFNEKMVRGSGEVYVIFSLKGDLARVSEALKGFFMERTVELSEEQFGRLGTHLDETIEIGKTYTLPEDFQLEGKDVLGKNSRMKIRKDRVFHVEQFVEVGAMDDEPTDIIWGNYGTTAAEKEAGLQKTYLMSFMVFLLIVAVVYVPFSWYLFLPYAAVGASPKPLTSQITGFLVGIANNILGTVFGMTSWSIGFIKRGNLNKYIIVFSTLTSIWNTVFNLSISLYPMRKGFDAVKLDITHDIIQTSGIGSEVDLSNFLYTVLCPGWLFAGFITGQLVGLIVPTIQNEVLLHLIFTVKCLPPPLAKLICNAIPFNPDPTEPLSARTSEKIFQWGELALSWDYSTLIVTPSVCFGMLFFVNPDMWKIFPRMLVWVSFMYCFHRFVHLRITKKQMHSFPEADMIALQLWGIPLSIVGAAWAYWRSRLGYCEKYAAITVFIASLLIYLVGIELSRYHGKSIAMHEKEQGYDITAKELLYNWWNTNPLYVLKANFGDARSRVEILPDHRSKPPVPFEFGKEYHHDPEQLERLKTTFLEQFKIGKYAKESVKGLNEVQSLLRRPGKVQVAHTISGRAIATMHVSLLIIISLFFVAKFL